MSPARLELHHADGTTPVLVGAGALAAGDELEPHVGGRRVFVVTSEPVRALHGHALEPLQALAGHTQVLEVPDGESAKRLSVAEELCRSMALGGGKRDSLIVGFGGGTVGDLAGFAAAVFLRGVDVVLAPTTLLAQVDAAVGGKTGVNLPEAKNLVGAFHHPVAVVSDTRLLQTLPVAELRSGLVEVIKIAVLEDPRLLETVERDLDRLLGGDAEALATVVEAAAAAKISVVEKDPAEKGVRKLLNLGHTLGHALEAACAYRGLRHGEAVGHGLLFALGLAESRGLRAADADRIRALLARLSLPALPPLAAGDLVERMRRDKKGDERCLTWVLPTAIGTARLDSDVSFEEVRSRLEEFLRQDRPRRF